MKSSVFFVLFTFICLTADAKQKSVVPYSDTIGYKFCQDKEKFDCLVVREKVTESKVVVRGKEKTVKKTAAETWEELFPDAAVRELAMKLNRLNVPLKKGMLIAVPKNLSGKTLQDFSPFPKWIKATDGKMMIFNPAFLAWAAYKPNGEMLRWGPAIGGMDRCLDTWRRCRTVVGTWKIIRIGDANSRSHVYPVGCGRKDKPCALMPWFMQFEAHGYGFHGSDKLVGKHASHGCVRLFTNDAEWLNQHFVEMGMRVITRQYPNKPKL
jgi:hypothetical protein